MMRINPEPNMDLFYKVGLTNDLFSDHGVLRQWGRRGTKGQQLIKWYESSLEAQNAFSKLVKENLDRGYLLKMVQNQENEGTMTPFEKWSPTGGPKKEVSCQCLDSISTILSN